MRPGGLWVVATTTTTSTSTPTTTTTTTGLLVNSKGTSLSSVFWQRFCSLENFTQAYEKARQDKWSKEIVEFEKNPRLLLVQLIHEVYTGAYSPRPLKRFVLRDPKTRIISKSAFRDRIVHHAIVQTLQPIFEPRFIHDSYASRKEKGTLPAVQRFEQFARKVSKNHTKPCFVLKCDIKSYFDTVDHAVLVRCIREQAEDERFINLITLVVSHHETKHVGKGMPLGNWTSQFFANIYLNKLDQFVKHELRVKHYIRYVDDFVILENNLELLAEYQERINTFLANSLVIKLHPTKCRVINYNRGVPFLGFRIFPRHKLILKRNLNKLRRRLNEKQLLLKNGLIEEQELFESFRGWCGYAMHANTYKLRTTIRTALKATVSSRSPTAAGDYK